MRFDRLAAGAAKHRSVAILASLLTTFAGVALLLDRPKGGILELLGIPLVVFGSALFSFMVWPSRNLEAGHGWTLASRLIRWATWQGRLIKIFPAFGVGILVSDLLYNMVLSATPAIQTEDTIVLLGAAALLVYGFVPDRLARERDFILVFFGALNAMLVVPLLAARIYYSDFERSVDLYSWVALAPQTSAMLSLLGVSNSVHAVPGLTAPGLTFRPQNISVSVTVVITTACSGIYSFGIFASAFVAFVLAENERISRRVLLLLALGFASSYVANVLRMVVIVLVGYYTDTAETELQNMLVAHSYAGWLIFLGWIAIFWSVVFRVFPHQANKVPEPPPQGTASVRKAQCGVCSQPLTPVMPASHCGCGSYHHLACLAGKTGCPACGKRLDLVGARPASPGSSFDHPDEGSL